MTILSIEPKRVAVEREVIADVLALFGVSGEAREELQDCDFKRFGEVVERGLRPDGA